MLLHVITRSNDPMTHNTPAIGADEAKTFLFAVGPVDCGGVIFSHSSHQTHARVI